MKQWVFTLWLCVSVVGSSIAQSRNEVLLHIPKTGASVSAFVPRGFDTLSFAEGDLNKDSLQDVAIVLKDTREDTAMMDDDVRTAGRILLVLLKTAYGWELAAKSDSVVLCKDCGGAFGDPFASIEISKGILIIGHYGGTSWRWSLTHKYRYQKNDMYLIGKTRYSFWNVEQCALLDDFAGTDYEDINLLTGDRERKKISQDCKLLIDKTDKIAVKPLLKMAEFKIDE